MKNVKNLIEFQCRGYRFALPLACVRRVAHSAQPTPLPGAPQIVLGMLDIAGEVAIVINFHGRIGLPFSTIELSQQLLLLDVSGWRMALLVDEVGAVITREVDDRLSVPEQLAGAGFVDSVIRVEEGLCIICDPDRFLLDDERILLGAALKKVGNAKQ
jgi:chemotaxis signal transduction protein